MAATVLAMALMAAAQAPAPLTTSPSNDAILKELAEMKARNAETNARIEQLENELKARGGVAPAPAAPAAEAQAPAAPAAPAAPPAPPTWSVGAMDISGYIDGYYSYNANSPSNDSDAGQINELYNFNDVTDQFALSAAKVTFNHDPDPIGAHIDILYGRTDIEMNGTYDYYENEGAGKYIEQAFLSYKPIKAKGFEADFGKFSTSAGAEVIESKDNWNYSRSLLFAHAIPYNHFGLRTSMPVSKTETLGLQVVNGFNTNEKLNNGVMIGLTSAYVKPKYTWNANYYVGPQNYDTQKGYLNLFDTTLLLTPNAKFNAYLNYDYGQNRDSTYTYGSSTYGDHNLNHWQGAAIAAREQILPKDAIAARYEFYFDPQGYTTPYTCDCEYSGYGPRRQFQEITFTYEHKWVEGLLARLEYRHDWTNFNYFTKGLYDASVKSQSTLTAGFVAFFGPKR
jgi:hypothetical protein